MIKSKNYKLTATQIIRFPNDVALIEGRHCSAYTRHAYIPHGPGSYNGNCLPFYLPFNFTGQTKCLFPTTHDHKRVMYPGGDSLVYIKSHHQ